MSLELASILATVWIAVLTARGYLRTQRRRDIQSAIRLRLMLAKIVDDEAVGAKQREVANAALTNSAAVEEIVGGKPFFTHDNAERWVSVGLELVVWIPLLLILLAAFFSGLSGGSSGSGTPVTSP